MRIVIIVLLTFLSLSSFAQEDLYAKTRPIVDEGKRMYKSEMASWYGTDLFLEKYKNKENIEGYFSYVDGDMAKCIFFSKGEQPKVIGTMLFDSTYNTQYAVVNLTERDFTSYETDIYTIWKLALEQVKSDTLFKHYKNSNLNLIPLIHNGEKKVYILTGPSQNGVVIFGNDYLMTFDKDNKLTSKKQLHTNIIIIDYGQKAEEGEEVESAMHTHLPSTGEFMTATDICTLMLYSKFAKWKQHNVISKDYLNIWDCSKNDLVVIPMSTIKKIEKDQEKRKKKNKGN